ncbi:LytS/YhcK type 5TM receptor domain-containing protein, partial [Planktotalea sp.]|uniref:LytS/YhcK type 5TM receptor domain-containing protein n=1 Tax=Planktotalea sp. TaxID=2029877 RepID=UPI0035C7EB61
LFLSQYYAGLLMGLAFGGVAWVQMNMPLEPMEGLILDLRNVPLALCAAFLGWRASLICFLIAAGTRLQIGGIGMPPAIWQCSLYGVLLPAGQK